MPRAPGSTTKRKPLTKLQRAKLIADHGGICYRCGLPIDPAKKWVDEHMRALALGGTNDMSNRAPVHWECAEIKTLTEDMPRIVKAKAVQAASVGRDPRAAPKLQSRGFPKQPKVRAIDKSALPKLQPRGLYR
jgi:5-methylcytosine-specific restriction enzyme A